MFFSGVPIQIVIPVRSRLPVTALLSRSVSISGSGLIEFEAEFTVGTAVVKLSFSEQPDPYPKKF